MLPDQCLVYDAVNSKNSLFGKALGACVYEHRTFSWQKNFRRVYLRESSGTRIVPRRNQTRQARGRDRFNFAVAVGTSFPLELVSWRPPLLAEGVGRLGTRRGHGRASRAGLACLVAVIRIRGRGHAHRRVEQRRLCKHVHRKDDQAELDDSRVAV